MGNRNTRDNGREMDRFGGRNNNYRNDNYRNDNNSYIRPPPSNPRGPPPGYASSSVNSRQVSESSDRPFNLAPPNNNNNVPVNNSKSSYASMMRNSVHSPRNSPTVDVDPNVKEVSVKNVVKDERKKEIEDLKSFGKNFELSSKTEDNVDEE